MKKDKKKFCAFPYPIRGQCRSQMDTWGPVWMTV